MKAAVLREVRKPLVIEDVQIGKPGPHEVLIRTVAAGVCHSDLHFVEGSYRYPLPAVLGHESAGVVEAVGSEVRTVKKGDHVITCLSAFCGHCDQCRPGLTQGRSRNSSRTPMSTTGTGESGSKPSTGVHMPLLDHACAAYARDHD